jgi:xylose isomerase
MPPIPERDRYSLVVRLVQGCGGAYSPEVRRKHYISGPQWAALQIRRQFLENAIW